MGYVNLGDANRQLENLDIGQEQNALAKYLLVFMVKGLTTNLTFPLSHYATDGITADLLYPLIWECIAGLEIDLDLKVLFITCDGASPNRKFFKLHGDTHFTPNPYCPERNVYFISDVPHLLKTARNCFSNSYSHRNSRALWRNGKSISWLHVKDLFTHYCDGVLRLCPKLSKAHIELTSFSCMNVRLAAQVLSSTVACALEAKYGEFVSETVGFIRVLNKFFDVMNTQSLDEWKAKRNVDLKPFESVDDVRLVWLQTEFLNYFETWKLMVQEREGDFSKTDRNKMMLSYQTLEGISLSTKSIVECVKYMLNVGADFILTRNFNQDKLEQFFGLLRMKGGAMDNPNAHIAGHMINSLRFIHTSQFEDVRGNVRARVEQHIDNRPLPRRPKQK